MRGSCSRDPASARQSGCGSAFFKHSIEHCFWTTRHRESSGEDHDWSSSSIHVDSADTRFARTQRLAIGLVIGRRTSADSNPDSGASATSFTSGPRGFTRRESVGLIVFSQFSLCAVRLRSLLDFFSGYNGRSPLNSLHAEVAELADAHV